MENLVLEAFWQTFLHNTGRDPSLRYAATYSFDLTQDVAHELLELVLKGQKRATASSLTCYEKEGEAVPQPGDLSVLTEFDGTPRCVVETTKVTIVPYRDMTFDLCRLEGEDDTLESWRQSHSHYFAEESRMVGYEFMPDMPVIFEEFRVVYREDAPEEMATFFEKRLQGYDEHMLAAVEGCAEGYEALAAALPEGTASLLDLGCGTGLELAPIFRRFPQANVTGVDMTQAMLDQLAAKYPNKALRLICGDYTAAPFEGAPFDAAVSFETMHHLAEDAKRALYGRIREALAPGGVYLEGDYMVLTDEEEQACARDAARLCEENGLTGAQRFHMDTPFTVSHQCRLLREAGFTRVEQLFRQGNTTLLKAEK